MVDIVFFAMPVHYIQKVAERGKNVFPCNRAERFGNAGRKDDAQNLPA